jgi:predicted ATPase
MNAAPSFAGRVEELQFLFQTLGKAAQGEPRAVFLMGAAGIGKSALLQTFGVRASFRQKSSYVFYIRPPESGRYAPLAQAALEATRKQLYDRVGGRRKAMDSARELLPEWVSAVPGIGELVAAIVATVQSIRRRRQRRLSTPGIALTDDAEALLAMAARRPLVLLLDDLQDADAPAVAELERLIRAAANGSRLMVVAAYCPTPPGVPDPPIHRLVRALPAGTMHHSKLDELTAHELQVWLKKRFPHVEVPADFLRWLYDDTGGHPATVESTLERLLNRSVIRFINRHWEIEEQVDKALGLDPGDTKLRVPTIDLSAVRPAVVDVLRAASSLGDEFDGATLALLLERDELYVEDHLSLAAQHKLVEMTGELALPDGEIATLFRFTSSHVRSVLARDLTLEDRARFAQRNGAIPSTG